MAYRVFVKNGCGSCKAVTTQLDKMGVEYTKIDVSTSEGFALAKQLGICSSGVIVDDEGKQVKLADLK